MTIFSHYLLLRKASSKMTEFWMNLRNIFILFMVFKISLWHWYGLKAFTEALNEYQNLEKMVDCLIMHRDSAYIFIVLKNAWNWLFWPSFNFQCNGVKRLKSFILYQQTHSFHYYPAKNGGTSHPSTHFVVGPA